jgi:RNA polymerase sigma factor (sigma-70 family)
MTIGIEEVIRLYGPGLQRTAASYERNPALRDELVQDIYLALVIALPRLRDLDSVRAYVFRVAHHRCVSHVMRQVREPVPVAEEGNHPDGDPWQEEVMIERERTSALMDAIRALSLPYRQVITLLLEELSYREIAEVLGLSESNVGARINRAKRQLKDMLDHG